MIIDFGKSVKACLRENYSDFTKILALFPKYRELVKHQIDPYAESEQIPANLRLALNCGTKRK
jgi:hypothetical protein